MKKFSPNASVYYQLCRGQLFLNVIQSKLNSSFLSWTRFTYLLITLTFSLHYTDLYTQLRYEKQNKCFNLAQSKNEVNMYCCLYNRNRYDETSTTQVNFIRQSWIWRQYSLEKKNTEIRLIFVIWAEQCWIPFHKLNANQNFNLIGTFLPSASWTTLIYILAYLFNV